MQLLILLPKVRNSLKNLLQVAPVRLTLAVDCLQDLAKHGLDPLIGGLHLHHGIVGQPLQVLPLLLGPLAQLCNPLVALEERILGELHLEILYVELPRQAGHQRPEVQLGGFPQGLEGA